MSWNVASDLVINYDESIIRVKDHFISVASIRENDASQNGAQTTNVNVKCYRSCSKWSRCPNCNFSQAIAKDSEGSMKPVKAIRPYLKIEQLLEK